MKGAANEPLPLRLVAIGHVDHGKSTLIGRLLHHGGRLNDDDLARVAAASQRRGAAFEWAFLLDALQEERDQGATIDVSRVRVVLGGRRIELIDAPGHRRFLRNMLTGATTADAALIVVDAVAGIGDQTRRHARLLKPAGIETALIAVNKMDAVGYDRRRFERLRDAIVADPALSGIEIVDCLPISAREGDGLATMGPSLSWHEGGTLIERLAALQTPGRLAEKAPFRMPVQDVHRRPEGRIAVGRIEAGSLSVGDEAIFAPTRQGARIVAIIGPSGAPRRRAVAGESIGVRVSGDPFVERGVLMSRRGDPPHESRIVRASLVWLGAAPLDRDRLYTLRLHTSRRSVSVQSLEEVIDADTLAPRPDAEDLRLDDIAQIVLRCDKPVAFDVFEDVAACGRLALFDDSGIVAAGIVPRGFYPDAVERMRSKNVSLQDSAVSRRRRERRHGHRGGVIWMTGYSGAGKSTLAFALERRLHAEGCEAYTLDGDNLRHGLSADLGFSANDRSENIRRVREAAWLMADAGMIAIVSLIAPFRADRDRARERLGDDFHEIHIAADLETCMARDPKGLYRRALDNEIKEFTGVHSPYEPPEAPELIIDTAALSFSESLDRLHAYVSDALRRGSDREERRPSQAPSQAPKGKGKKP